MGQSKRGRGALVLPMLLAALLHDAAAQTPSTVVITAPRPVDPEGYRATEARIKDILSHRPALSSPFLSWCMEHRYDQENGAFSGGPLPLQNGRALAIHLKCATAHIEATDTALKQALDAFDKHDYAAALGFFQEAYSKMGTPDAALMLAIKSVAPPMGKADVANATADAERAGPPNRAGTSAAQVVRVTGLRAVPWKSYRAMRAAVAAFEKYKLLAPDAVFRFAVPPPVGKTLPANTRTTSPRRPRFDLRICSHDRSRMDPRHP